MQLKRSTITRILLFSLFTLAVAAVFYFGLLSYLTLENVQWLNDKLGWWAPGVFLLAFIIGELLQVPSVLWIFFAGVIWPIWLAIPIALLSALLAATGAFLVARYFMGDKILDVLPPRVRHLDTRVKRNPVRAVITIRLTTFLHPLVHWALAASSIRLPAFLLGTFIGILPATLAIVLLGQQFLDYWADYSLPMVAMALLLVVWHLKRPKLTSAEISHKEAEK